MTRYGPPRAPVPEWWKVIAMGVLLAGLVYVTFFYQPATGQLGMGEPVTRAQVTVPEIDQQLLRTVKDATHTERLVLEPAPLAHLLEKSIDIVPSVAEALGIPDEPIAVSILRAMPGTYRGAYLWYRGELKSLSPGKSGHPVDGYRIYEGWIETAGQEIVSFRMSLPPQVEVGDFVRVEGFFLKLRDSARSPEASQAPLLVGPELFPDYRPWDQVTELDAATFESIRDGVVENGKFVDFQDATRKLEESQDEPLWTLASYAVHRSGGEEDTLAHWRAVPAFVSKEQLDRCRFGQVAAGTPFRLLGTFQWGEWFKARPNPAGIDHWTQAWIQIRDLGGKIVPVWIPKKISDIDFHQSLEVRAYYFRRYVYDVVHEERTGSVVQKMDAQAFTPVFVAADLTRFEVGAEHPASIWTKYAFASLVGLIILLFFFITRRDRKARDQHEQAMIERRRRRRGRESAAAAGAGA